MMMTWFGAASPLSVVAIVLATVLVMLFLRSYKEGRFKIGLIEIGAALAVAAFYMFFSGEIKELSVGDVKLTRNLERAARRPALAASSAVEFKELPADPKLGTSQIPRYRRSGLEALSFTIGGQQYDSSVIREYLTQLTTKGKLKYLVFNDTDGATVCIADAVRLAQAVRTDSFANELTEWIRGGELDALTSLPGYVYKDDFIRMDMTKAEALDTLVTAALVEAPVVDDKGRFIGVARRDDIVAALTLALAEGAK